MLGPKVIRVEDPETASIEPMPRETGIRRGNTGAWAAVKQGRLVESFTGAGSKARAIRAAGTNRVIA